MPPESRLMRACDGALAGVVGGFLQCRTMDWIYLDNNATTRPAERVVEAMRLALAQDWANPSSVHRLGQQARRQVELARSATAALIHCSDSELVLTSGGTESINLALRGSLLQRRWDRPPLLITTAIEHAAVRETAEMLAAGGVDVELLPLRRGGLIDPGDLEAMLADRAAQRDLTVVSVHWANNETGVIEPIARLAEVCRAAGPKVLFHTDAVQAVGKIPVDVREAPVDLLSFAAHKFHGPKGVGGLYVRRGVRLGRQLAGGAQERQRRGGTENVPGIVGLGIAAQLAGEFVSDEKQIARLAGMRDRFEQSVCSAVDDAVVNGGAARLWNTSNVGFARLEAEAIVVGLSERGVCVSAGAACSSGSLEPSAVLLAMGIDEATAHGSVRFSLSRQTTEAELTGAAEHVAAVVGKLRRSMPTG